MQDYLEILNPKNYKDTPDDWFIVLTDISGSTNAVETGNYKEVNIIGASVIVALKNMCQPLEIPYVFGGDGATAILPPEFRADVESVLNDTREMAKQSFGFDLRCAIIPVRDIHKAGKEILVSKYMVSNLYSNAVFSGGGIDYAEKLMKDKNSAQNYFVKKLDAGYKADYSGLECRWDNVKPENGKIVALLIKSKGNGHLEDTAIYRDVMVALNEIIPDLLNNKLFETQDIKFTFSWKKLNLETKIHSFGNKIKKVLYPLKLYIQILLGMFFMKYNVTTNEFNWGEYKPVLIKNTDSKKFDEMVRMVINIDETQLAKMIDILENFRSAGKIVYGYNVSETAILTCIVEKRKDDHYHLIDGAEGGYALAAKMLKGML